jgi:hypothetical protein
MLTVRRAVAAELAADSWLTAATEGLLMVHSIFSRAASGKARDVSEFVPHGRSSPRSKMAAR